MRRKLVTVGHPSRIRQLEPEPVPIDPASSEQLGSGPAYAQAFGSAIAQEERHVNQHLSSQKGKNL
jgi:hypothetical protein